MCLLHLKNIWMKVVLQYTMPIIVNCKKNHFVQFVINGSIFIKQLYVQ